MKAISSAGFALLVGSPEDLFMAIQTKPQIVIPTEVEAIATANRWLHQEIGMALHVTTATFDPVSYYEIY